jgi:hypothetical protein
MTCSEGSWAPSSPETSTDASESTHQGGNRPSYGPNGPFTCNGCDSFWTGLNSGHCSACHRSFTSVSAFDKHRSGSHTDRRYCLDPATVGLVPADKPWPGWSWPAGGWIGPMRPPPHGESA